MKKVLKNVCHKNILEAAQVFLNNLLICNETGARESEGSSQHHSEVVMLFEPANFCTEPFVRIHGQKNKCSVTR